MAGHLTPSQRAAIAVDLLPHLEAEAKERLKTKSQPSQKIDGANGRASEKAAATVGTNRQYVSDMKAIKAEAPALRHRQHPRRLRSALQACTEAEGR